MECLACHTPNVDGARFCAKCGAPLPIQKEADADPLIGTTIGGRYRVTGILGEGGMGRVYTAEQQMGTSVRRVAVKTLLSQFAKDPQTVARFMREVGTVSELEHPNTIKVYDFGQIEGSGELYIAMELLQGKSLDDVLHEHMQHHRAMDPERVDRIIGQVCGSLQEAHDKGIVHRDLKPANIFLTTRAGEEDVVKVLDFGIAKRGSKDSKNEQKLTQQGTILGTPPYMSPEQFTGRELDARSDIYSLAIVTYEMLTGQLPFDADTPWQWMTQHMSAQPAPFESLQKAANVPPKMRNAVLRALAKDAAHRPQSAREFFEELTLGNTRMSVVGLGAGGVGGMPVVSGPSGGTAMLRAPTPTGGGMPAQRPMGTQVGEPLFPEGAPGPTQSGYEPYQPAAAVPTAGGQVYPAPPAPAQKKSGGGGAIVAVLVGLLMVGGGVGGFLYWKSTQTAAADDKEEETVELPKPKTTATSEASATATAEATATATATATAAASASATASETAVASASASESASASSTAVATTTTTAHTTSHPTASTTAHKPQPGIDACCARVKKPGDRALCNRMNEGIKSGKLNRQSAIATLRGQGVNCH